MKNLLDYMRHKDGTYVSMDLTPESKSQLDNFLNMTLDPMPRVDPDTYHVTIIYSRTPVPDAEKYKDSRSVYEAIPSKFEVFPTKNDGQCLVLKLDFPFGVALNSQLTKMGATSDYDEYKPHVTIAYDTEVDIDPSTLSLPRFPIQLHNIKVAPLDTDYSPPTKK
jgi:2'-5' RNA ligase